MSGRREQPLEPWSKAEEVGIAGRSFWKQRSARNGSTSGWSPLGAPLCEDDGLPVVKDGSGKKKPAFGVFAKAGLWDALSDAKRCRSHLLVGAGACYTRPLDRSRSRTRPPRPAPRGPRRWGTRRTISRPNPVAARRPRSLVASRRAASPEPPHRP